MSQMKSRIFGERHVVRGRRQPGLPMCQGVMVTVIRFFFETEPCCWIRIGLCTNYAGSCNEKAIDRYHRRWAGMMVGLTKICLLEWCEMKWVQHFEANKIKATLPTTAGGALGRGTQSWIFHGAGKSLNGAMTGGSIEVPQDLSAHTTSQE